eukprot:m.32198 g.32198  ORF g.32198 m.32198 type:complete len:330 (+) comp42261_c0_seq1:282-1271(+)
MGLSEMFPTQGSLAIFLTYIGLGVSQVMLITNSKGPDGSYQYNPTTVVLLTEACKLVVCFGLYVREFSISAAIAEISQNKKVFLLYFIPAGLYCLYNNLSYVNLTRVGPTTYTLLMQLRVAITGVVFQVLFKQKLSRMQWISIGTLTTGCLIHQANFSNPSEALIPLDLNVALLIFQMCCACGAGVYNEYLLKNRGGDVHVMIQNVFMYTDSIISNGLILGFNGELTTAFSSTNLASIMNWNVIAIILNNAAMGVVTSLFLKHLNSILKTYAAAMDILTIALLSWFLFGIAIRFQTAVAIILIGSALYMYSLKPVQNAALPSTVPPPKT